MILKDPSLSDNPNLDCRATYEPDKEPALPIMLPVSECLRRCPNYEGSHVNVLSQWIGPLVGFLLPALAFVISIPRSIRLPRGESLFGARKLKSIPYFLVAIFLMMFDVIFWIITVFAFAGPLIAGATHEALIDHAVLDYAEKALATEPEIALMAVTFSLIGSLKPDKGDMAGKVSAYIVESPHAKRKLQALLSLLPSYGARVGVPIVFYVGAYFYAIFDASAKRGDNDTAHAVAFGLWYGVVVIVAIVSSSVLGVDNPASLEAVFSENVPTNLDPNGPRTSNPLPVRTHTHPYHFHDSHFHTVWMWKRARVFQEWTKYFPLDPLIGSKINSVTPRIVSGLLASILVALPCAGACWISYQTPEIGFGCRSVAHLIYATSQMVLIGAWWTYYSSGFRIRETHHQQRLTLTSIPTYAISAVAVLAAVVSAIGGTIMQLVGVFRNCLCKASLQYLLPKNRWQGTVNLANDTQAHRDHAKWWIIVGSIGVGFIGLVSLVGWGYQARIRSRCRRIIEGL
ncbi:hypothetical protein K505DRAFT_336444 [Melanomma pulvis-pyrius CBS 109.77]|uniref:Uncharacterized protein n=1 Tax=Melanomma pulvis-pyrius CBS 109.77 TaxID=1314802 RepID=A0A6A6XEQ4_9PLEO|nr:hypothetical protein K505DRAFT_336444 [Melanomma pulvis-pyrius CBS 109.77]